MSKAEDHKINIQFEEHNECERVDNQTILNMCKTYPGFAQYLKESENENKSINYDKRLDSLPNNIFDVALAFFDLIAQTTNKKEKELLIFSVPNILDSIRYEIQANHAETEYKINLQKREDNIKLDAIMNKLNKNDSKETE
jgi:hypothetical protein